MSNKHKTYKKGDKVICLIDYNENGSPTLHKGGVYEIQDVVVDIRYNNHFWIIDDGGYLYQSITDNFTSLSEYRNLTIKELLNS